jgi:hypothetical protein
MRQYYIFISTTIAILIIGCSASVDDRFSKQSTPKDEIISSTKSENLIEDFDFTGYETDAKIGLIPLKEKQSQVSVKNSDLWFTFDDDATLKKKKITKRKGYRVQILLTDNYNQADSLRSIIYFKTNHKNIYVEYESPFYKVKVGDYIDITSANQLGFKLRQLGFQTTLIVADSVNTIINND